MKENKAAENALGTIGAVFWTIQILPQIIKSHRTKSTKGLSAALMFIWAVSALFLGSYIIAQGLSIPLQIQPQLFGVLAAISWCQCLHYESGWSKKRAIAAVVVFCTIFAGFEAGSVYALWAGQDNGVDWPITLYGYITAILLAVALLPQYYEIYRLRKVVGISMSFMAVDILGGVFSLLSLFFRAKLDRLAVASYALVVVLDGVVVVLAWILNPIAKRHEDEARAEEDGRAGVVPNETIDSGHAETSALPPSVSTQQNASSPAPILGQQQHQSQGVEEKNGNGNGIGIGSDLGPGSIDEKRQRRASDVDSDDREGRESRHGERTPLSPSPPGHGHGHGREQSHEHGLGHLAHEMGLDQGEFTPMHFRTISRTSAS